MTTLILGDRVIDAGIGALDTEATHIYVCRARPTTYLQAVTSPSISPDNGYALGNKNFGVGAAFGTPFTNSPDVTGRYITSSAVLDGLITYSGTVVYWAVVDSVNSRLLLTGPITTNGSPAVDDVTDGQSFQLGAFTIRLQSDSTVWTGVSSGLTHHWPMSDLNVAGTVVRDVTGGLHGSANGSGVTSAVGPSGAAGTARAFDGVNVITLSSAPIADTANSDVTICLWCYVPDVTAHNSDLDDVPFFFNFGDGTETASFLYIVATSPAAATVEVTCAVGGNAFNNGGYGPQLTSAGWHHFSMTKPGTGDRSAAKLYKNGVDQGAGGSASQGGIAGNRLIGGRSSNGHRLTPGTRISRLVTYNRVLSAAEILQNYRAF